MGYPEAQYAIDEILNNLSRVSGSGIPPKNVEMSLSTDNISIAVTWIGQKTTIQNKIVCTPGGVIIVAKEGSAPEGMTDGFYVKDYSGAEFWDHSENPIFIEGIEPNKTYYIRAFTYSDQRVFNYVENTQSITTGEVYMMGFKQTFSNYDAETTIEYIEANEHFTPMMTNVTSGDFTMGSWGVWYWLRKIKPYMVHADGTADYPLDPNDYTKKLDGTASDISNPEYDGGGFVWLPKLYMKETYSDDGNIREVRFSNNNTSSLTSDFKPLGFTKLVDGVSTELDGIWLPMFYLSEVDGEYKNIANTTPLSMVSSDEVMSKVISDFPDHAFLGGPIMNFLRDLEYMLFKTTDIQTKSGFGRGLYSDESSLPSNAVVNNGAFYGTGMLVRNMNKLFHSIVLGSYIGEVWDPFFMLINHNEEHYCGMMDNYDCENIGVRSSYVNLGQLYNVNTVTFPVKMTNISNKIGSVPIAINNNLGSNTTGLCDAFYGNSSTTGMFNAARLGSTVDHQCGPGYFTLTHTPANTETALNVVYAMVYLPPVEYSPE